MVMKTRVMAMYLPQFYAFEENSTWWGEGFTDWDAVRQSRAMFPGHDMPRLPMNDYYYDLTEPTALAWQADLAKKHGVDGFCIYHYWSRGRKLMEKPTELLREHTEIDIDYFLCWANHDFRKTWFDGDGHMLWPQEYGGEDDHRAHYAYLSAFFADRRYVKIDNKPVVMLYRAHAIEELDVMASVWNELAQQEGYDGVYLIASMSTTGIGANELQRLPGIDAAFVFEPMNVRTNGAGDSRAYMTWRRIMTVAVRLWNRLTPWPMQERFSYVKANERMLRRKKCGKQFYCAFPGWDNTPRYSGKGTAFVGSTPALFGKYAKALYRRSKAEGNELFFINAWNEWGESAYLEPDQRYGTAYLQALKEALDE